MPELSLTNDIYSLAVDDNGNYIDHSPFINIGIYCPCSNTKKLYGNKNFNVHKKQKLIKSGCKC